MENKLKNFAVDLDNSILKILNQYLYYLIEHLEIYLAKIFNYCLKQLKKEMNKVTIS